MTAEDLLKRCINVLQRHAPPDGLSDHEALNELYAILDGPECLRVLGGAASAERPDDGVIKAER